MDDEAVAARPRTGGWRALSTSPEAAVAHYEAVLAADVLMLLPGGSSSTDRAEVVASMQAGPWDSFTLSDERVVELEGDAAVVAYQATAHRGDVEYRALFSST